MGHDWSRPKRPEPVALTVAQLIERLKTFPPDLPVCYRDVEWGVLAVNAIEQVGTEEATEANHSHPAPECVWLYQKEGW